MRTWMPLLLVGCASERYFELAAAPACPVDVVPYDDGLYGFLVASGTDDGRFDVAPPRPLEARAQGAYDLDDGAFSWVRTYAPGYWKVEERVTGEGMVWPDGDVDLRWDSVTELADGSTLLQELRLVRLGCEVHMGVRNRFGTLVADERGEVGADAYAYTRTRAQADHVVEVEGTLQPDGRREEREAWRIDRYQVELERVDDGAGIVVTDFIEVDEGVVREGTIRQAPAGTERRRYVETAPGYVATWDLQLALGGRGDGTVEVEPVRREAYACEVQVRAGGCTQVCEGRPDVDCVVGGP